MRTRLLFLPCAIALALSGCDSKSETPAAPAGGSTATPTGKKAPEPDHVEVDHILIGIENLNAAPGGFSGKWALPKARVIAYDLLARLKAGGDWAKAKEEYSEDGQPGNRGGPYGMANYGVKTLPGERQRTGPQGMVPAFGNVGFKLAVGEIGIADFHPEASPYGFHIIKRTK